MGYLRSNKFCAFFSACIFACKEACAEVMVSVDCEPWPPPSAKLAITAAAVSAMDDILASRRRMKLMRW